MHKIAHVILVSSIAIAMKPALAVTAGSPANCTKEKCEVTVSVGGNSCGGGISVSPDPVIVTASGSGAVTITWKVTGGWNFDTNGIVVVLPGKEILVKPINPGNKTEFVAVNEAKTKGSFKYDINLVKGAAKCSLDPTIVNH